MARRELPLSVHAFTGALAAAAVLGAAATGARGFEAPAWVVLALAGALLVGGLTQLEFHWRGEREALDLFEAAMVPVLAVLAGPGAVALVAVTKAGSQRLLRVAPVKAAFNVAQWSASASAAGFVYDRLRGSAPIDDLALAAAMVVAMVVNHVAVAVVIALAQRGSVRDVLSGLAPIVMPGWIVAGSVNISLGLLFAATVVAQPELAVLFVVPLGVFAWAQRAYSEVLTDRTRIEALQRSTHELAAQERATDALPAVLEAVRTAFSSACVGVVLGDTVQIHAGPDDMREIVASLAATASAHGGRRIEAGDGSAEGALLASSAHRCALVAPLRSKGREAGVLVSIDRHGLDGLEVGEVAVFEALAGEIASALERTDLNAVVRRERARLSGIVEGSSDGIFTVAPDGTIVDWNPAMADITGFPVPEAKGGGVVALLRPQTDNGVEVALDRWHAEGWVELPAEIIVLTRSGEPRTLACSFSETAGESRSLVVVARDVTRQRELDRLRDDFVATVSHELRTPLTSIVGFTSMLIEPPRPLTQTEHDEVIAIIRKCARRLDRLVFNLLEVSRIEHHPPPVPVPVDIGAACRSAIAELRESYPDREILLDVGSGAVRAVGNRLSIEQILTNLIGNALKYSERGPIDVRVTEAAGALTVSVTDAGPGIPQAEQDRIFERFHRVDHHHVQAGTGLGLYISRQLAAAMNGTLTVASERDKGSTFSLTLPAELHLKAVS